MYDSTISPGERVKGRDGKAKRHSLPRRSRNAVATYRKQEYGLDERRVVTHLQFPILKGLREDVMSTLNSRMVTQKYEKKSYVYLPYESSEKVYFVKRGFIEIGYLDESGRELAIDVLNEGEVFGSFMGVGSNGGFARSLNPAVLGVLHKADFDALLERSPRFAARIFALLNGRITILERKLRSLVFQDVKTRICCLLSYLYVKAGEQENGLIKVPLTHQDIANLVASSRETASLHLSELKKDGIISYERKQIRVISLRRLKEHAACLQ